ncbi:MAG: hypothetical protein V1806_00885 [Pseudomonadota bacterium]
MSTSFQGLCTQDQDEPFILYMLGNSSPKGGHVTRFALPQSETQAHQMIIGTQRYVDWANPDIVRKLSQIYFDNGEPINSAVSSIYTDLVDLKNIRNAAAHLSSTTSKSFYGVVSRRLGLINPGISVSDYLLSLDSSYSTTTTILEHYLSLLDATSYNIVYWA